MIEPFIENIVCQKCRAGLERNQEFWKCPSCGLLIPIHQGEPVFTLIPDKVVPSEKIIRRADSGSRWRQADWKFLEQELEKLEAQAKILDSGCGHGDFASLFAGHPFLELDIYPYPEVDLVCDLTLCVPFQENSFDLVVLMNVVEHVPEPQTLLKVVYQLLSPGGIAVVAVPFMLKIHQAPIDFARFTHYALQKMAVEIGFQVSGLQAFVDPAGMIAEVTRYYQYWEFPNSKFVQCMIARLYMFAIKANVSGLELFSGRGKLKDVNTMIYPAPTGYQMVLKKSSRGFHS